MSGPSPRAAALFSLLLIPAPPAAHASLMARAAAGPVPGQAAAGAGEQTPVIDRRDDRFDALIPPRAALEKVADGFRWVEGPVWDGRGGHLLFSDIPANSIFKWSEGAAPILFLKPSGYSGSAPFTGEEPGSNGLTFDPAGRLALCEHGDRRISRLEADGRRTVLADRYEGKRLNSPNDLVYRSNGDLYFTDPPFGLPRAFEDPGKELDFQGVFRLAKDGRLTLLTRELRAPNGLAFSPDERTLYVSDARRDRPVWMAFEVRSDGTLGAGRVFFDGSDWAGRWKGAPDGMKVDRQGNLFAAGPGGVHVFAPDGTHLGSLLTGVATSNCAWGGDGSVLYVTAGTAVYRIRTGTRGARL